MEFYLDMNMANISHLMNANPISSHAMGYDISKRSMPQNDGSNETGEIDEKLEAAYSKKIAKEEKIAKKEKILQLDGYGDSEDEDEDDADHLFESTTRNEKPPAQDTIGSDLDDLDSEEEQETEDFILCQYEKVCSFNLSH
jgi:hypothetical protein